jgi:hypothetical protein
MRDDFGVDSKLCRQFRDYRLIDCGSIEMRLRVDAASDEVQRCGKDYRVPGSHGHIFSNRVPWELGNIERLQLAPTSGLAGDWSLCP